MHACRSTLEDPTWIAQGIVRFQPPISLPLTLDVGLDWRVVLFTLGTAVATGLLFGLAPALRASRPDLNADLREGMRGSAGRSRFRSALVTVQLAVSVVLLVGSALLLRSLAGASRVDLGFNPAGAATVAIDPAEQGYDDDKAQAFLEELLRRTRQIPGVSVASATSRPPLNLNVSTNQIVAEGHEVPDARYPEIQVTAIAPDYVAAIGARLTGGREFTDRDRADQPLVVMVNRAAAELLWPGQDAVGRRLANHGANGRGAWREVVGVVDNVKVLSVGEDARPQVFYPLYQRFDSYLTIVARTTGDPAPLTNTLRQLVKQMDPGMPIIGVGVLADVVTTALFPLRFAAYLLIVLGAAGLGIAAVGLYGIIAQGVAARTRELGIRMALGARTDDVLRMVLVDGLKLSLVGMVAGLAIAAAGSRLLSTWLYQTSAHDLIAFSVAPAVLLLVAIAASIIPARRATRVNPVEALRSE